MSRYAETTRMTMARPVDPGRVRFIETFSSRNQIVIQKMPLQTKTARSRTKSAIDMADMIVPNFSHDRVRTQRLVRAPPGPWLVPGDAGPQQRRLADRDQRHRDRPPRAIRR